MSVGKEPFTLPQALKEHLLSCRYLLLLTGAGVSAESGVPTFRDAQTGLWSQFRPEQLATPEAFEDDPETVWRWYAWRRELISQVKPNPGHYAITELEQKVERFLLVTQNVDGLHQQAGSQNVVELHGNILRNICSRTRRPIDDEWLQQHPGCPPASPFAEDGYARPDVVWFGETLPRQALDLALSAVTECDLVIVAGTSGMVEPAASLPRWAKDHGAVVVDINPEPSAISRLATYYLQGTSAQWFPILERSLPGTR